MKETEQRRHELAVAAGDRLPVVVEANLEIAREVDAVRGHF